MTRKSGCILLLLFTLCEGAQTANLGEIDVNFGTDLVSKTASKDLKNYPSGYSSEGLIRLKEVADNEEVDGYWGHKGAYLLSVEYIHPSYASNKIKIGIGTKIVKKYVKALYCVFEDEGPDGPLEPPAPGGGIYQFPLNNILSDPLFTFYKKLYLLPVYFIVQLNPFSDKFDGIYFRTNIGYSFIIKDDLFGKANYYNASSLWEYKREGGLCFVLEIGNEFKLNDTLGLILGMFYDYVSYKSVVTDVGTFHGPLKHAELTNIDHIFGIKTGVKFKL
ncbi:hypothetical protein [Candidatus Endomicrobiellum agilis]|uniref:hypothetical protein n=1 Tax=Candidatus Endomicrobiellum agilis TaxID=3238957 RepID=UPI00358C29AA|nr:hypothetical protein [Endomicrobium sp.]